MRSGEHRDSQAKGSDPKGTGPLFFMLMYLSNLVAVPRIERGTRGL
jgi:hypothetical protein